MENFYTLMGGTARKTNETLRLYLSSFGKVAIFALFFLTNRSMAFSQCNSVVYYDNMEAYTWFGDWYLYNYSNFYNNISVSPTTSAAHYGVGNSSSAIEQDWYVLPNITGLNPAYTYKVKFRLASTLLNSSSAGTRGVDVDDYIDVQLSTNGGVSYSSEIRIKGNSNAQWNYSATGVAAKTANGTLTQFTTPTGTQYALRPGGYSTVELTLPAGSTQCAIDIYTRVNSAGEDFWIDNVELIEVIPQPSLSIAGNTAICSGGSLTLTASGAQTYSWNNGISNGVAFSPAASTTYTVTGTNTGMINGSGTQNSCSSTLNASITVNQPSVAPTSISGTTTICNGSSTTLTANGTLGTGAVYQWGTGSTVGTNSISGSTASITVSPTSTTTYWVRITNTTSPCTATTSGVTSTVTVNAQPAAAAGGTQTICQTGTATVSGASSSNGTILWTENGAGSITAGATTLTPTYTAAAGDVGTTVTLTMTVTSNNACSPQTSTAAYSVVVNALPTVTALANPNTICEGQSATLTGAGASTYSWSNSAGSGASVSASPTANTTYTVTGTDANGCTNTATASVTVNNTADFANLQFPQSASISCGSSVAVYGKIYDAALTPTAGANATITVEVGVSTSNTNPSTWASGAWSAATFNAQVSNDDEYTANIGSTLTPGAYYYTFRYQIGSTGCYKYGGYNGGFWNGTTNVNGTLTVNGSILDYANVQFPTSGSICSGGTYTVYGQVYEAGVTNGAGAAVGMIADIGVSSSNTDPSTWAAGTWSAATFNSQVGNNDEFVATIGSTLSAGTYYYAFRYKLASACNYQYGAVNGFWNGTSNTNGVLTVGSATTSSVSSGDYIWKGTTNTDWSTASNWITYNGTAYTVATVPPTSSNKVIIPTLSAGCVVTQPATITNLSGSANDILIESGASLGLSTATLSVSGNWTNNGTFTPGSGTIAFVGTSGNQSITKTGGETFTYITVNKASGNVILANNVTVVGGLTLTSGKVELGTNNLNLGSASLTGGSSSSYVKTASTGILSRNVAGTATTFPIGNGSYNPATLTNAGTADVFSLRVIDNVTSNGTGAGATTTEAVVNRTWMLEEATVGGSNVTLRLQWNGAGEQINTFSPSSAFIAHYIAGSSMWDNIGGTVGADYVESAGITSFSPFTISSSPTFAPLPVELLSLDAQCAGDNVIVSWKTASEHNSLNFVLERSEDGTAWSEIQTVAAAGNSNTVLEYAIEDAGAARGVKYYRLIQTDQDGVQKIYGPILSNCGSDNNLFMSFPNPSDADITLVFNNKNIIGSTTLTVRDANGRVVRSMALEIQLGTTSILIPNMELTPGVYYLQLEGDNFTSPVIRHSLR